MSVRQSSEGMGDVVGWRSGEVRASHRLGDEVAGAVTEAGRGRWCGGEGPLHN